MTPSVEVGIARAVGQGHAGTLAELQRLRDRCIELEDALGARAARAFPLRMPPACRTMLGALLDRAQVSTDQVAALIYGGRPEADWPGDPRNVIKQRKCLLARLLTPHGITIETINGEPYNPTYVMAPESKAKARALIAQRAGRVMA